MHPYEIVSWFKSREWKKGRGRPKITLVEVKKDMSIKEVTKSMTLERIQWRKRIRVGDQLFFWGSIANPKRKEGLRVGCLGGG